MNYFLITFITLIFTLSFILLYIKQTKKKEAYEDKKEFTILAINQMFRIAGHYDMNYQKAIEDDNFYYKYPMTREQRKKWYDWFISYSIEVLEWDEEYAQKQFEWLNSNFGLLDSRELKQ